MTLPQRIYLIGMPASGKTTLGQQIAQDLNYPFYDLDWELEKLDGRSIPEIFKQDGEDFFREKEREVLRAVAPKPAVIATGGGAPCFFNNIEVLLEQGYCLYLSTPAAILAQRAWERVGSRPLLLQDTLQEMQEEIEKKLTFRKAYYEQAQQTITMEEARQIEDWKVFFEKK